MSLSPVSFSNHILTCLEKLDQRQSYGNSNNDVYNQLMSSIDSLCNPYACNHYPLSDTERNEIVSGKVSLKKSSNYNLTPESPSQSSATTISLSQEQIQGVLKFSTEFQLSEHECLHLWHRASQNENKRLAEQMFQLNAYSLDGHVDDVARIMYYLERYANINAVTELIKHRNSNSPNETIMRVSNQMLKKNIVSNIVKAIEKVLEEITTKNKKSTPTVPGSNTPNMLPTTQTPSTIFGNTSSTGATIGMGMGGAFGTTAISTQTQNLNTQQHGNLNSANTASINGLLTIELQMHILNLHLLKLSECLFFILYSTQLLIKEFEECSKLLNEISCLIIDKTMLPVLNSSFTDTSLSDAVVRSNYLKYMNTVEDWKKYLMNSLVIISLAMYCCLGQTGAAKLDRNIDEPPFALAHIDSQSRLPHHTVKECIMSKSIRGLGLKGYMHLLLSMFTQPYVDDAIIDSSDIISYLKEASQLRAYSFIRLCVLPTLQYGFSSLGSGTGSSGGSTPAAASSPVNSSGGSGSLSVTSSGSVSSTLVSFLNDTMQEFLVELARVYAIYKDMDLYVTCVNIESFRESKPTVDCLDDLMNMYSVGCHQFVSLPLVLANDGKTGTDNPYQYHPFFVRCIELSWKDPLLMLAGLRLLSGVGKFIWALPDNWRDRVGSNSVGVYHYLKNNAGLRRSMSAWEFIFVDCIDSFAVQLGGSGSIGQSTPLVQSTQSYMSGGSGGSGAGYNTPGNVGMTNGINPSVTTTATAASLSDIDCQYLMAIADVISHIGRCPEVAQALHTDYQAVPRLFNLLACPVSIYLKGSLFRAIAALAYGSKDCARQAWMHIELHNLLSINTMTTVQSISKPTFQQLQLQNNPYQQSFGQSPAGGVRPVPLQAQSDNATLLNISRGHRNSLRYDFESSESPAGVYPCSEGFLLLLETLLGYGSPDLLGHEYRIPGITLYIEYILDHIFSRTSSAKLLYAPDTVQGLAQRWRLNARVLRILTLIVQYYDINNYTASAGGTTSGGNSSGGTGTGVSSSTYSHTHTSSVQMRDGSGGSAAAVTAVEWFKPLDPSHDFTVSEPVSYTLHREDGMLIDRKSPRPKTAGFVVMSLVLATGSGQNKLLTQILSLLQECSLDSIAKSYQRMFHASAESSVSIMSIMQPSERPPYLYGLDENLSSIGLTMDTTCQCDDGFWREKTVAAAIGLLYEISLREQSFILMIHHSKHLITFIKNEHDNIPTSVTVVPQSLIEGLSSTIHLSKIAQFLNLTHSHSFSICTPTIPTMVVTLLEYIAVHQSPAIFLGNMVGDTTTSSSSSSSSQSEVKTRLSLVEAICTSPIKQFEYLMQQSNISKLAMDYGSLYTFSSSALSTLHPPLSAAATIQTLLQTYDLSELGYESIRTAVLNLILTTLSTKQLCMSHTFLGIKSCIEKIIDLNHDPVMLAEQLPTPVSGSPSTCLEAIIEIMSINHFNQRKAYSHAHMTSGEQLGVGSTATATADTTGGAMSSGDSDSSSAEDQYTSYLLILEPNVAMLCYELMYRLCSQPLTSALILTYLRRPAIDFLSGQVQLFLELMSVSDRDLEARSRAIIQARYVHMSGCSRLNTNTTATGTSSTATREGVLSGGSMHRETTSSSAAAGGGGGGGVTGVTGGYVDIDKEIKAHMDQVKTARHHCMGWLLQICSLEPRLLSHSPAVSPNKLRRLLDLLFMENTFSGNHVSINSYNYNGNSSSSINGSSSGVNGDSYSASADQAVCPLTHFLWSSFDLPRDSFPVIKSKFSLQCMEEATTPLVVGRGAGSGVDHCAMFSIVDIAHFTKLLIEIPKTTHLAQQQQQQLYQSSQAAMMAASPFQHFGSSSSGSGSGSDAIPKLSRHEIETSLHAVIMMNIYQKRMSAAVHLCHGWCQLVDTCLLTQTSQVLLPSFGIHLQDSMSKFVNAMILPTLSILTTDKTCEMIMVERLIKTCLVMVTTVKKLAVAAAVTDSTSTSTTPAPPNTTTDNYGNGNTNTLNSSLLVCNKSQHRAMLELLLTILLRSSKTAGTGTGAGGSSSISSTFTTSSVYFRGLIYTAITHLLTWESADKKLSTYSTYSGSDNDNGSGSGNDNQRKKEGGGDGIDDDTTQNAEFGNLQTTNSFIQEVVQSRQEVLAQFIAPLTMLLGSDACTGPLIWRLAAMSTMQAIIHALAQGCTFDWSDRDNNNSNSSSTSANKQPYKDSTTSRSTQHDRATFQAYYTCLQALHQKGYLSEIVANAFQSNPRAEPLDIFNDNPYQNNATSAIVSDTFETVLGLCSALTRTSEGANILINLGLLNHLVELNTFVEPITNTLSDDLFFGNSAGLSGTAAAAGGGGNNMSVDMSILSQTIEFESQLLASLNVLLSVSTHFINRPVIEANLKFLRKNHATIRYYLRMRSLTLNGLLMTQTIIQLIAVSATLPPSNSNTVNGSDMLKLTFGKTDYVGNINISTLTPAKTNTRDYSQDDSTLFDTILGPFADSFTIDVIRLLHKLGSNPIPYVCNYADSILNHDLNRNYSHNNNFNTSQGGPSEMGGPTGTSDYEWWHKIQVVPGTYDEELNNQILTSFSNDTLHGGSYNRRKNDDYDINDRYNYSYNNYSESNNISSMWTAFDEQKLNCVIDILNHSSAFLRIRAMSISEFKNLNVLAAVSTTSARKSSKMDYFNSKKVSLASSLLVMDFSLISKTVYTCASILRKFISENKNNNYEKMERNTSMDWLQNTSFLTNDIILLIENGSSSSSSSNGDSSSPQSVHSIRDKDIKKYNHMLQYLIENLLCVMNILVTAASVTTDTRQLEQWRPDIERCILVTDKWPTHTFIRQLSRWISEKIGE